MRDDAMTDNPRASAAAMPTVMAALCEALGRALPPDALTELVVAIAGVADRAAERREADALERAALDAERLRLAEAQAEAIRRAEGAERRAAALADDSARLRAALVQARRAIDAALDAPVDVVMADADTTALAREPQPSCAEADATPLALESRMVREGACDAAAGHAASGCASPGQDNPSATRALDATRLPDRARRERRLTLPSAAPGPSSPAAAPS